MRQIMRREAPKKKYQNTNRSANVSRKISDNIHSNINNMAPWLVAHMRTTKPVNGMGAMGEREERMDQVAHNMPLLWQLMR